LSGPIDGAIAVLDVYLREGGIVGIKRRGS
jgi:hypothetical protein